MLGEHYVLDVAAISDWSEESVLAMVRRLVPADRHGSVDGNIAHALLEEVLPVWTAAQEACRRHGNDLWDEGQEEDGSTADVVSPPPEAQSFGAVFDGDGELVGMGSLKECGAGVQGYFQGPGE